MADTDDLAPYCVATQACPHAVRVYVVLTKYLDKLDEALASDKAVQVASVNPKLAQHPMVAEALDNLAEALGIAVNQLAAAFSAAKATGYKPLDKAVDKSHPH